MAQVLSPLTMFPSGNIFFAMVFAHVRTRTGRLPLVANR